jgi:(1->4)-alpha-D-glucan 1-alpha-D-glucosylmutase
LYVVVEKILEKGEALPGEWPVAGTVGYEFAAVVTGLFVDQSSRKAFDEFYTRFTGNRVTFADLVYERKKHIMRVALVSEVNVLARALDRLTERNRRTRDYTLNNLRDAMREIIACFPVYRTYAACGEPEISPRDRRYIDEAVNQALRRNPGSDRGVFEFIRDVLLLRQPDDAGEAERAERCRFVMKFQQLTGPVMAKGVEDTAFYQYNRLLSLNEVGGDPASFGASVSDFHQHCRSLARHWPSGMLASSTHDTKRSEDVRARISALTEMPREWRAAVNRWARANRRLKQRVQGFAAPDRNDEYHFYQTLVGIWPFDGVPDASLRERLHDYMLKAAREAQTHTSWLSPNVEYEAALTSFVSNALTPGQRNAFLDDVRQFMPAVMRAGAFNALSQQLLKLTAPGVPDVYQGTELWDFSLVDPDNRRPVDFEQRIDALAQLGSGVCRPELLAELLADLPSGKIKLYLTARALAHRAAHPDLFARGTYEPLQTQGPLAENLIAFARVHEDEQLIVVAPRLVRRLLSDSEGAPIGDCWRGVTALLPEEDAGARYCNVLSGETVDAISSGDGPVLEVSDVLGRVPVALLQRIPAPPGRKRTGEPQTP